MYLRKKNLRANTKGTYTPVGPSDIITAGNSADIKFADIDGDGFLDVIFNGYSNADAGKGIALNDGIGAFTHSEMDITEANNKIV